MPAINVLDVCGNKGPAGIFPGFDHHKSHVSVSGCGILTLMAESSTRFDPLKPAGFVLLLTGWFLVLAALALLTKPAARGAFVAAGLGVESLGLVLVVRSHIAPKPDSMRQEHARPEYIREERN